MRKTGAILSFAGLVWGFLLAPFDHIHPEGLDHHAASAPAHVHFRSAPSAPGLYIGTHTDGDDEVDVQWSVSAPSPVAYHAALDRTEAVGFSGLHLIAGTVLCPPHCGHDPPELTSTNPRAPPA